MKYTVTVNGRVFEVEVERAGGKTLSRASSSAPRAAAPVAAPVAPVAPAPVAAPAPAAPVSAGENTVTSPMPGSIFDIKVNPGDAVKSGQVVIILEAMKMETEIVAPADGIVDEVLVRKGDAVETDTPLVTLK